MKLMKYTDLLIQAESDLGLNTPFQKGQKITVKKCWHFTTDGNAIDRIFDDDEDFIAGMNRIYVVIHNYDILILAFCLMDTHIHFILYGELDACNRFMHEYIRRTSMHISSRHGEYRKLADIPIHYQTIDNDWYLKNAICYTIKNPPAAGLRYTHIDYPWSSGALYFRSKGYWTSPVHCIDEVHTQPTDLSIHKKRELLKVHITLDISNIKIIGNTIFPGEYVEYRLVEKLFKSPKGFNYFIYTSREEDIESKGGAISRLSIPIQEMRQYRNEICKDVFKVNTIRMLNVEQRLRLARILKSRYHSSIKQVARVCGLIPEEVKSLM